MTGARAVQPDRAALVAAASAVIREGSRSFHAASQLFDRTTRERAWLLYSWCRHCDDVCDGQDLGHNSSRAPGNLAQIEALTRRTLEGDPDDALPYQALAGVLQDCAIPHRFLTDHVQGFVLDAQGWRPQDEADLITYCYHVAGAVGCMMAVIMGVDPKDEVTLASAAALGIAFQLSNIARDVCEDQAVGRCYVPATWLREHKIDPAEPFKQQDRAGLVAIAERLVELAGRYEQASRAGLPKLPFRARWAVLAASRIYGAIGRRVVALGPTAWDERIVIRRRTKLAYMCSSFFETLRTREGQDGSFRLHRTASARTLSAAVPPRRRVAGARSPGHLRPPS